MNNLQDELKEVSKALSSLSRQLKKLATQVRKLEQVKKAPPASKTKTVAPKVPKKKAEKVMAEKTSTVLDSVYEVIRRSRNGASIATLKARTGLKPRQLSNALYKLSRRGKIEAKSRGVYVRK